MAAAGLAVALDGAPKVYPYICFFDRPGRPAVEPPELTPNPVVIVEEQIWESSEPLEPNAEQAAAIAAVTGMLGRFSCHLLEGVTGGGKTEIYLQAIAAVLRKQQQALVLVPEIGLTPQLLPATVGSTKRIASSVTKSRVVR